MGQSVEVVVSELTSAASRLADAGQRLQDRLSAVDLEVGQLLGAGWEGGAASAFQTEWDTWHNGAGQVVRGLQTMSQMLTIAGREYAKTDEDAAGAVGSAMRTPGGGPGGAAAQLNAGGQGAVRELAHRMNLAAPPASPATEGARIPGAGPR
ncbi:WXG100 family type VII secretion target [Mycobacterium sp. IS-1742]|uniref:WXG100 family type VII secretion target n=1 Tax=Mycobacterium sp. IS-1742 TaxID=1772285 RepID=UPI0009EAE6E4|nr:WXG100 family type VII secretion target [Mycobacterium sp. IS-1742]